MIKMKFGLMAAILSVSAVFTSCECDDDCLCHNPVGDYDPTAYHDVNVHLEVDSVFEDGEIIEVARSKARVSSQSSYLRYIVNAYNWKGEIVDSRITTEKDITMNLPGNYRIVAYADYSIEGSDNYYFTDDFSLLQFRNIDYYQANDEAKRCYSTICYSDTVRNHQANLLLKTPQAKIRLLATDEPDYEVGNIKVTYSRMYTAWDAITEQPTARTNAISFDGARISTQDGTVIGFDYLFAEQNRNNIAITITVYDADGKVRGKISNLSVPVERGKITTIKAPFHSKNTDITEGGGGIGINPDFDDDIVIVI